MLADIQSSIRFIPITLPFNIPFEFLIIAAGALLLLCTVYGIRDVLLSTENNLAESKATIKTIAPIPYGSSKNRRVLITAEYTINGFSRTGRCSSDEGLHKVGEKISVLVNPKAPEQFWLKGENRTASSKLAKLLPWTLLGLFCIFLIIGGIRWLMY
ncbi:MAG TPA: hypothetical protein P5191_01325 [Ruminococcus sp.]|nr:hypothetical protein [Ruminococcus sp.]